MRLIPCIAALFLIASPHVCAAQSRDVPTTQAARPADTVARGWAALAEGRNAEAVAIAQRILSKRPWDHAAVALQITALSAATPARALDVYEQWLGIGTDDVGLLEPVAIGILQQIAAGADRALAREAARALVDALAPGSEAILGKLGSAPGEQNTLAADAALARSGDPDALARLNTAAMADIATSAPVVARALESAGGAGVPALTRLAGSTNPMTRAAAIQSLGRMHADQARTVLERAASDQDPTVRSAATIALAKLGDPSAFSRVSQMIDSEVPEIRIMAADAWEGRDGPWVAALMPLLDNTDGLVRVQAARLIAPINPEAARRALAVAAADPNPVLRAESAQAMSELAAARTAAVSFAELRKLLRDPDATTRVAAARGLLEAARAGAR